VPQPPPTVSLEQDEGPALPPLPQYVPPQPPPLLQPFQLTRPIPPRPMAPRQYARPSNNPFANPQNWALNQAPSAPGRSSRGIDLSVGQSAGEREASMGYVSGARPTGDWIGALRRWAQARLYYPEEALAEHQQGTAVVLLTIDRSGKVLNVELLSSARSPFLDQAWLGVWRGATVPAFTPDMTEPATQITYTLHYILHGG
jgi:protein TonB